ncbi:hypothetical protein [Agarilytica rhodophyticola]|uniref:hypothetical protein n=1 Tax=Agarilytica rhodophyticola TaxID=1737490 RepID=UPI000B3429FF|nr:hypothetical protein [Agarilytica rhodophyticola]
MIKKVLFLFISLFFTDIAKAISISKEQLIGTWNVRNETVDPLYSSTEGKITFYGNGTITVDNGAFAAASIFAKGESNDCGIYEGPIHYKTLGRGKFYLYWSGKQVVKTYQLQDHEQNKLTEELDSVVELVNKRIKIINGKYYIQLTLIGQGGCANNPGIVKISYLSKEIDEPGEPILACKKLLSEDKNACKEDFFHVGSDQSTVVPAGAKFMRVKAWGAGGNRDNGARGGVGGYTTAVIPISAGEVYTVVVGRWGNNGGVGHYGFGGSGGGLSGIFSGTEAVISSDQARAIIVAGGGGASSDGRFGIRNGRNGNDPANLTISDNMAASCRVGRGGGGAGYMGGQLSTGSCSGTNRTAFGYGGSGFISSIAEPLFSSIETGFINCTTGVTARVPANYLDEDWQRVAEEPCRGPGSEESASNRGAAVIIEWLDELP